MIKTIKRAEAMVDYAKAFIGLKYVWGGNDAHDGGFDCSGLILEILRSVGLWGSSDTSAKGLFTSLIDQGWQLVDQADLQAGDILFYGKTRQTIDHVSMAINDWQIIEAGGGSETIKRGMTRVRTLTWRKDCCAIIRPRELL